METFELGDRNGPRARVQFSTSGEGGARLDLLRGYRTVEVDTPSSQKLRDLGSFRRDIEMAQVFCDQLLEHGLDSINGARHPHLALWIAALTTYGRAFKTGVRVTELPSIEILDEEETRWHQYLLNLRDKHVAHAVNENEHAIVIAFLTDSAFAHRSISRVGLSHIELKPTDEEARVLTNLCAKVLADLNRRMRALEGVITKELMAMGEKAVYALPDLVVPTYDPENVAKRRKGTSPTRRSPKASG